MKLSVRHEANVEESNDMAIQVHKQSEIQNPKKEVLPLVNYKAKN
jgi:hypothetical protein